MLITLINQQNSLIAGLQQWSHSTIQTQSRDNRPYRESTKTEPEKMFVGLALASKLKRASQQGPIVYVTRGLAISQIKSHPY